MRFGSEGPEIHYIAEVGTEDQHRKLNSNNDDRADLDANDPQAKEDLIAQYQ